MRRVREALTPGPVILLAFAGFMAVLAAVTFAFDGSDLITHLLPAGVAAAAALAAAVTVALRVARAPGGERVIAVDTLSLPTALLAAGLAGLVVGAEVGPWLLLVGGGVTLVALAGIVREWRTRPR